MKSLIWVPQPKPDCIDEKEIHRRFYRVLVDYKDVYYIWDSQKKAALHLPGMLDSGIVFNNVKFHEEYLQCKSKEDIDTLIFKWYEKFPRHFGNPIDDVVGAINSTIEIRRGYTPRKIRIRR